jgi:hypothetical protein
VSWPLGRTLAIRSHWLPSSHPCARKKRKGGAPINRLEKWLEDVLGYYSILRADGAIFPEWARMMQADQMI